MILVTTWNYFFYKQLFSKKKADTERRLELLIESIGTRIVNLVNKLLEISETKWFMAALTTMSVIILLGASLYSGLQATKLQSVTSDQFIGTYNYSDDAPSVDISHTNILKAPVLWAQGNLPYNFFSLAAVNVGFIFLSFIFWIFLLYKLLGYKVIPLASLAFSTFLINSTSFTVNITMMIIRHIEYPLALLFVLGLSKLMSRTKNYLWLSALLSMLLGGLVLHDYFFLYTLVPSGMIMTIAYLFSGRINLNLLPKNIAVLITGPILAVIARKTSISFTDEHREWLYTGTIIFAI